MRSHQVAPGVHALALSVSNVYVLHDEADVAGGFAIVDSGTSLDWRRLVRAVEPFGGIARCTMILQTHAHPDHAGSAALVARASGAPILAHQLERPFLERGRVYGHGQPLASKIAFALGRVLWRVRRVQVSRVFEDGDILETPAGAWRVAHTPGHTRGHVSFWRESDGVLLSGDALLSILPWTRRAGLSLPQPIFTQDAALALRSVRKLADLRPRLLLPGHGRPMELEPQVLEAKIEEWSRTR